MLSSGETHLFPALRHDGEYAPTKALSQWYGRYMDRLGITDKKVAFHSLRHNFKDRCRGKMTLEVHDRLTGHTKGDASYNYGWGLGIEDLDMHLQKVAYPSLSFHAPLPGAADGRADNEGE